MASNDELPDIPDLPGEDSNDEVPEPEEKADHSGSNGHFVDRRSRTICFGL